MSMLIQESQSMSEERFKAIEALVLELVECCVYEKQYKREEVYQRFEQLLDNLKEAKAAETGWK